MSIWNICEKKRKIKVLENDINVDTLIIGGGMTGLNTAYYLKEKDKICVVDANIIGHGVTLNSTAKINYLQQCIYTKIANLTNCDNAKKYLQFQINAIKDLKSIIETEKISCDLKKVSSYVFANSLKEVNNLNNEIKFLNDNNIKVIEKDFKINVKNYKSICVDDTYIFNPIKYLNSLYKVLVNNNIDIYEKTKIVKIEKHNNYYLCYTENNRIKAYNVVLACHYPYFLLPLLMPLKCSLEKSYIIVSKVKEDGNFTCISSNNPVYSCRYYDDGKNTYQISLGKSNNLSSNQNDKYLFKRVKEIFALKDEDILMCYTNTDIITPDYLPYIGKIDNRLYIGVGYNTWGMTNSLVASRIISDYILNNKSDVENIFDPNRYSIQNFLKLPLYIWNNMKTYIGTKLHKNKSWYSNNVYFIKKDGQSLAIYRDNDGNKHIVYNKCPHLGCSLLFNEVEKTWDCPCHSSRFNLDGKCIKGPSNYDISYKE